MRFGCAAPAIVAVLLSGLFLAVGALSANVWIAVGCLALSFFCNQLTEGPFSAAQSASVAATPLPPAASSIRAETASDS